MVSHSAVTSGLNEPEKPTTNLTTEETKTGATITKVSVVGPPERNKRKNIVVNTNHCRTEIDTLQYVVNKYGYREAASAADGNLIWYGLALRDHDIDVIKVR